MASDGIEYAGIEYLGIAGSSQDCQEAVIRRVQYGERIHQARILSSARTHCLLLANEIGDQAAVKSGFASGYGGEGPAALSYALQTEEHTSALQSPSDLVHRHL